MLINRIRESIIGDKLGISTSFGTKPLIYADYTASGRALSLIEDLIREKVLPMYANTHTDTTATGAATSELRRLSKAQARHFFAVPDDYSVIYCGYGATAAVNKAIDLLGLRDSPSDNDLPVVFIGPYEHHSNELPWRECNVDLVVIPLTRDGVLDIQELDRQLQDYSDRTTKIGSFSAASNVTGLMTDIEAVTALLHRHGALSFWDFAAAAPYLAVDCQGQVKPGLDTRKDAVFISPHKFIGGPETPGVLLIRNSIVPRCPPAVPGGGTVSYVTSVDHVYHHDLERREEAGTPSIIGAIRAGLVFKLYAEVRSQAVASEVSGVDIAQIMTRWLRHPNIEILGNTTKPRLPIISLQIRHHNRYLHYGFVVAVLNDVFGIQSRGGCSCAGPYGHQLLGFNLSEAKLLESLVLSGHSIMRPGWVRLNICQFMDASTVDYIVDAVELVATHGWRLLSHYTFDESVGCWLYQGNKPVSQTWFEAFQFADAKPVDSTTKLHKQAMPSLDTYLQLGKAEMLMKRERLPELAVSIPESAEPLRWFVLPQEVVAG